MIFTGAVFVLMVIFLPGGLVGAARRWLAPSAVRAEVGPGSARMFADE